MISCPERGNNAGSGPLVRGSMAYACNQKRGQDGGYINRVGGDADEM